MYGIYSMCIICMCSMCSVRVVCGICVVCIICVCGICGVPVWRVCGIHVCLGGVYGVYAFNKIQHPFMIKVLERAEIQGT